MLQSWAVELHLRQHMVTRHAHNLVGCSWWCSLWDYLLCWVLFCCLHLERWEGKLALSKLAQAGAIYPCASACSRILRRLLHASFRSSCVGCCQLLALSFYVRCRSSLHGICMHACMQYPWWVSDKRACTACGSFMSWDQASKVCCTVNLCC
jgi:hypothetical protein